MPEKLGSPCFFRRVESVECRKLDMELAEDEREMLCDLAQEDLVSRSWI